MEQEPLVCGVPVSQAERFLSVIRVGYPMTELATSFLEERAGIKNVQGIANVRDALSHLATFLDPGLDSEEREKQISYAEEHLRRAIIEPYQVNSSSSMKNTKNNSCRSWRGMKACEAPLTRSR